MPERIPVRHTEMVYGGLTMFRKFALSTAAATLALSPVAAQAAAAERTAAPMTAESEQIFGNVLWPILIAIAIGIGIWLIVDDDDEVDPPVSP